MCLYTKRYVCVYGYITDDDGFMCDKNLANINFIIKKK